MNRTENYTESISVYCKGSSRKVSQVSQAFYLLANLTKPKTPV